jgi:RNA polymerase sigma factor (TIGR02999 family)
VVTLAEITRTGEHHPSPLAIIADVGIRARNSPTMSNVTQILRQIQSGDSAAAEQLLPLVYEELRQLAARKLANEKPGQTLQATALVHEAYLRLVTGDESKRWDGRRHFFAAAAEAMRRILVESARHKKRLKHGGGLRRQDLEAIQPALDAPPDELLALDEALTELAALHPEKAELVKLRYFAGMTIPEAAQALGVSTSTADRHWSYARAWLFRRLKDVTSTA